MRLFYNHNTISRVSKINNNSSASFSTYHNQISQIVSKMAFYSLFIWIGNLVWEKDIFKGGT